MSQEIQNFFKENGYVVIRNFLTPEIARLMYEYSITKVQRENYRYTYHRNTYHEDWDGKWGDTQTPNAYSAYADPLMESLLILSKNSMEEFTGLTLLPQYSYWRFYQKHSDLKRHKDRNSCEISTTLCLGYDVSDVDQSVYPDYDWPMWVQGKSGEEIPVHMKPGDMIIYRGCDLDHWREPFIGLNHAQIFMHYNDVNGPLKGSYDETKYDGRDTWGIPKL